MAISQSPAVGSWFKDADGISFEVVSVDDDTGTIFIQYFDGMIDELNVERWHALAFEDREPPAPWISIDIMGGTREETVDWEGPEQWCAGPLDVVE